MYALYVLVHFKEMLPDSFCITGFHRQILGKKNMASSGNPLKKVALFSMLLEKVRKQDSETSLFIFLVLFFT